ncbi:MAG: fibronectin type III-like domain-contianing protein, partial [Bacteroidales bacterium]|nr:fibronectin type III-like domain-contianing protein [Bacteroidales bacterium]
GVPTGKTIGMFPITEETYSEGVFVGYRYFDTENVTPLFPFGYGLSYTTFEYGEPKADSSSMTKDGKITFTVPVTNTGSVAGAEVVQLYISDSEASVKRPEKELKGFGKVYLEPGQTAEVKMTIDSSALSFFDASSHSWVAESEEFTALIASSSRDVKGSVKFNLK